MLIRGHRLGRLLLVLLASLLIASCGTSASSTSPTAAGQTGATSDSPSPSVAATSLAPSLAPSSSSIGFAFAAEDITGYYETQGYACTGPAPSTKAAGYTFRTCQTVDAAGRTRVIGVVMDPTGELADGWASVEGTASETILAPTDALDALAGFLGAMLGKESGAALLPWLAGHLGDTYAETSIGAIRVATYTPSKTDHTTLYVEAANPEYLASPGVSKP